MTNVQRAFIPVVIGLAVGLAAHAPPASAAITMLGPGSPITSAIAGVGTVNFSPTPATEILQVTDPDYSTDFPDQNTGTVLNGVANVFGLPAVSLSFVQGAVNPGPTFNVTTASPYNYAAIHNDHGELIFFYSSAQTNFSFTTAAQLSNINFFTTSVPEPVSLVLLGTALASATLMRRRKNGASAVREGL